jgi:hypothetical protein
MKLLKNILFTLLMSLALTAFATDQGLKVDLLMAKITASLKADKAVDALPYFAELESMESTLAKPLPQSFHYYYIDALSKSGNNDKALSRAEIYLNKFGKKGKYYDKVIEIISPIQIQKDKEKAAQNAKMLEYTQAIDRYNADMKDCKENVQPEEIKRLRIEYDRLDNQCPHFYGAASCVEMAAREDEYPDIGRKAKRLLQRTENAKHQLGEAYSLCENKYKKPNMPQ